MITLEPIARALVPVDSAAAKAISGPNYDEFQGDREIWELIQANPASVLRVTMAHCDTPSGEAWLEEGSEAALDRAARNMAALVESDATRIVEEMLWVYEIARADQEQRQIGIGGLARTGEIRTSDNPDGSIIRNEGVREEKARGRADLIGRTQAYVGVVNNTVEDPAGELLARLRSAADARPADFEVEDEKGWRHRVWLVTGAEEMASFQELLAAEPCAYVADGNHRSAAAAMLGRDHFLSVFFPCQTMGISPYNRLVETSSRFDEVRDRVEQSFEIEELAGTAGYEPEQTHEVGLYADGKWYRLRPKAETYDASNAVEVIDADIVQRKPFAEVLGIEDPTDERLRYVGANKDADYLARQADAGPSRWAITLPAVTMPQFIEVCRQNRFMPPKSTWFEPKVRSGLVMSLFD